MLCCPWDPCQSHWVVESFAFRHISKMKGRRMELGRHVKENRARLGMSQEQLAEAIFVSRQTISNWETDRTYPDVQSLLLLSNLFDVSIDELVKGDVEEMKAVLTSEVQRFKRLSIIMVVFSVAMVVWVLATSLMDMDAPVIAIPAVVLFTPSLVCAAMAEKIKRDNQLYTYRTVEAFMRGESPDVTDEQNLKAGQMWLVKLIVKGVLGAAIGLCCGLGFANILIKLLG